MKTNNSLFALILLLLFAVGCGGKPSVSGKVTFPDGTPMGVGWVYFESATSRAEGALKEDGTFTMTSGGTQGVTAGTYKVYFGGYGPVYETRGTTSDGGLNMVMVDDIKSPIADKYLSVNTTDLTCEVKGRKTHNIVVEPAK